MATPIVPLETYLVILPVAYIAREMAGLRLCCGDALWSPQTGSTARSCCTAWPPTREPQLRLKWRLYSHAVPERLRRLLDSRLPEVLRIRGHTDEIAAGW